MHDSTFCEALGQHTYEFIYTSLHLIYFSPLLCQHQLSLRKESEKVPDKQGWPSSFCTFFFSLNGHHLSSQKKILQCKPITRAPLEGATVEDRQKSFNTRATTWTIALVPKWSEDTKKSNSEHRQKRKKRSALAENVSKQFMPMCVCLWKVHELQCGDLICLATSELLFSCWRPGFLWQTLSYNVARSHWKRATEAFHFLWGQTSAPWLKVVCHCSGIDKPEIKFTQEQQDYGREPWKQLFQWAQHMRRLDPELQKKKSLSDSLREEYLGNDSCCNAVDTMPNNTI